MANLPAILYLGNDMVVEIPELTDSKTDVAVTTGTGTFTLKNSAGTTVASGSLSHVGSGTWQGDIASSVSLSNDGSYSLEIAITSSGRDAAWRKPCKAQYRT